MDEIGNRMESKPLSRLTCERQKIDSVAHQIVNFVLKQVNGKSCQETEKMCFNQDQNSAHIFITYIAPHTFLQTQCAVALSQLLFWRKKNVSFEKNFSKKLLRTAASSVDPISIINKSMNRRVVIEKSILLVCTVFHHASPFQLPKRTRLVGFCAAKIGRKVADHNFSKVSADQQLQSQLLRRNFIECKFFHIGSNQFESINQLIFFAAGPDLEGRTAVATISCASSEFELTLPFFIDLQRFY